jgi:hypothetical protein
VTALILASTNGHVEVVKLLVALPGLDYNHKNKRVSERDDVFDSNPLIYVLEICMCLPIHNCVGFVTAGCDCTYLCKC